MVSAISSAIENRAFLNNSKAIGSWMAVMALSPSTAGASRWHHPFAGAHTTLSGHKSPLLLPCIRQDRCSRISYQGKTITMARFNLWFMPIYSELPMYESTIFPKMLEVREEIDHDVLMPHCTLAIGSTAAEPIMQRTALRGAAEAGR